MSKMSIKNNHKSTALTFLILFYSFSIVSNLFSQDSSNSIDSIYTKPNSGQVWGDLYSSIFSKNQFGKSYAIVIGIGDYAKWPKLESPYYDAIRVRDFLI